MHSISILGSTGSIGRQTVAVAEHLGLDVRALTTNRNIQLVEEQARRLHPAFVAVYDETAAKALRIALADTDIAVGSGERGLCEAAVISGAQTVVTAVSGAVGLRPTLEAIEKGRRIALANKETLVCAGEIVMQRARQFDAEIVPVDSEHSAIFQCLTGRNGELKKILLTGSGGPFRGWTREQTASVTPEQAVKHPNWSMGAKISVDSATMMNKGLEFIEAMHLFGVTPDDIQVLIHPESVVHSMVELVDGTVIAQLGVPNMELPIQYALTYPERTESLCGTLDFTQLTNGLHFYAPELERLPCLALAMRCARTGGTAPSVMNAANEVAVGLFLNHQIGYNEIYDSVAAAVETIPATAAPDLDTIRAADAAARDFVRSYFHV
ncbi:MAG: 1-deoxy-D-xylulose-5-phosphate reductoisomerase [Clostridiales bacterium]|nr:1-deoxy-D-xylulose-5-phosphate reductoisomerase [Clostridiales bacterium]MDD6936629.1 1-deoxy-D-xylulose-5-phosphate reductoisomerase [Clostridiales bacterium]